MTDDLVKRLREGDEFERFILAERAADRIEELEAKLAKAMEALEGVLGACDQGREIPRVGVGGMTIEANIKGSIYTGVPAWPVEEARIALAELTGGKDE